MWPTYQWLHGIEVPDNAGIGSQPLKRAQPARTRQLAPHYGSSLYQYPPVRRRRVYLGVNTCHTLPGPSLKVSREVAHYTGG
jgi:hypothetical protein